MKPVLLTVANQPISAFGLMLLLAFLAAAFVIWRVVKIYEIDEERSIDLIILTFAGAVISSRIYFILFHIAEFNTLTKIILINRYPGLSFWGGLFGGFLTLRLLCRRFKLNFWQIADFAIPGLFIGMAFVDIGCLMGSCQSGFPSNLPIAVTQIGLIGKRFPIQIIEFTLFFTSFIFLWRSTLKFHTTGGVAALGIILIGIYKFCLEFFYTDKQILVYPLSLGSIFSVIITLYGITVYYLSNKRSFTKDIYFIKTLMVNKDKRNLVLSRISKNWYNLVVNSKIFLNKWRRKLLKMTNVKPNPHEF